MRPPVFIIGYMASGKTTFGRALARKTSRQFIDLDFYIEQRFRRSITEIFATEGEDHFRKLESAMLHEVADFEDVVIACGGGTPCFFDNIEHMLGRGEVVFLEATVDRITERIIANNSRRPLMAGKSPLEIREAVTEGLGNRLPFYTRASIRHDGTNLENRHQIDANIQQFLEANPGLS